MYLFFLLQDVLLFIFFSFFKAYFFTRAGAGQRKTRSRSRSKMDRLRNTDYRTLNPDPNRAKILDPDKIQYIWIHNTALCTIVQDLFLTFSWQFSFKMEGQIRIHQNNSDPDGFGFLTLKNK